MAELALSNDPAVLPSSGGLRYSPLRIISAPQVHEFRLLKILRSHERTVACELRSFDVHHAPSYRALSYTWISPFELETTAATPRLAPHGTIAHEHDGVAARARAAITGHVASSIDENTIEDDAAEDILVDGQFVSVGVNLAAGLRAIRDWHDDGGNAFVWADAICIDQGNYQERAYQVAIMGEIYSNADHVFIWLGEEAQDSDVAISFLKVLARIRRDADGGRARALSMAQNPTYLRQWKALSALMRRRWFERAWVLQETVLARRALFCCGRTTLSDENMLDGFETLWHAGNDLWDMFHHHDDVKMHIPTRNFMNGMTRVRAARLDGRLFPILTVHHRSMGLVATDPRDHIYGKISIANDGYLVRITYTNPADQVYRDFVLDYIKGKQSVDIIHFDARPRAMPGIPSWVPDWRAGFGAVPLQPGPADNPDTTLRYFCASKGQPAQDIRYDDSIAGLVCKGYIVDVVDGVSRAEEASFMGHEPERLASQPRSSRSAYPGGDAEVFEAIWRTATRSRTELDYALEPQHVATLVESFLDMARRLDTGQVDPRMSRFSNTVLSLKDFQVFGRNVQNRLSSSFTQALEDLAASVPSHIRAAAEDAMSVGMMFRRLLTTQGGYLGTAPIETEPGDIIAVLLGSDVPSILRPTIVDGNYQMIGSANIHSIMYGEAVEREQSHGNLPKIITLI